MSERIVYWNQSFLPENMAHLSLFDSALTTGEKVVEVSRTFNHSPYQLKDHIERLYKGLTELRIEIDLTPEQLLDITEITLEQNLPLEPDFVDWQILNYVSRGPASHFEVVPEEELSPTIIVHCIPLLRRLGKMAQKYVNGTDLVVVPQRAIPNKVVPPQIKSNGRMDHVIGRLQAKEIKPGSTGVLLDQDNFITEGTGSSFFIVRQGVIQTAPTEKVLSGITRKLIFEIADQLHIPVEECNLTPEDAQQAEEIFITSTVICLLHGRSFGNHLINRGVLGKITQQVRNAFNEEVGLDFAQQAQLYATFLMAENQKNEN